MHTLNGRQCAGKCVRTAEAGGEAAERRRGGLIGVKKILSRLEPGVAWAAGRSPLARALPVAVPGSADTPGAAPSTGQLKSRG